MNFPATTDQLKRAGYVEKFQRACKLCGVHLEFWETPSKKLMPIHVQISNRGQWLRVPHFQECQHRTKAAAEVSEKSQQGELFK